MQSGSGLLYRLPGILSAILLLYLGKDLFIPMAFALLCALSAYPLAHYLEKKGWSRSMAILPPLLLIVLLFGAFATLFGWLINDIIEKIVTLWPQIVMALDKLSLNIESATGISVQQQLEFLAGQITHLKDNAGSALAFSLQQTASLLVYVILIPVLIYLFLYHRSRLLAFLLTQLPETWRPAVPLALRNAVFTFFRYLQGILIVYTIVGILNSAGLALLHIPNALGFGLLAALLTAVPFVGIILGSIPPLVLALTLHDSIWYPLGVVAIFSLVQYLEANLIFPLAVGNRLQMNALSVMVVMLGGGLIWGMAGLILFLPALAIFRVLGTEIPPLKPWADLIGDQLESK